MHYTKPKLIQLIHIAKQRLAMDEYTYRALLLRITNKESTKEMTITELMKVFEEMKKKGFKPTSRRHHSPRTHQATARSKIASKIRAIWIDMAKQGKVRDGSEQALNTWVRSVANPILQKQNRPIVLNVGALEDDIATIVLERLKKWQTREK